MGLWRNECRNDEHPLHVKEKKVLVSGKSQERDGHQGKRLLVNIRAGKDNGWYVEKYKSGI